MTPDPNCPSCEALGSPRACKLGHVHIVQLVAQPESYGTIIALGNDGVLYYTDVTIYTSTVRGNLGTFRKPWKILQAREEEPTDE